MSRPQIQAFFDADTNTVSYIVTDPASSHCAIIDPYDGAQRIVDAVRDQQLTVDWLLETHVHADHLSAAPWIQQQLGGKLAIGEHIRTVQDTFGRIFNAGSEFARDGRQFDHLFRDGEAYTVGNMDARAIHTPGHTPACMSHVIGDAVFVGDTLFMPDYGTARCVVTPAPCIVQSKSCWPCPMQRACSCAMTICRRDERSLSGKRRWPNSANTTFMSMKAPAKTPLSACAKPVMPRWICLA